MPTHQDPMDRAPDSAFVPATDDEALADIGPENFQNPVFVGQLFWEAVTASGGPMLGALSMLVTPESRATWGDFSKVATVLREAAITTKADYPAFGEPGVAYIKYVTDLSVEGTQVVADVMVNAVVATLQYRPEFEGWRVHHLGAAMKPEDLPSLA